MEFTVTYDKLSLNAAARALFLHRWDPLFPGPAIFLTIAALIVGISSYVLTGPVSRTALFLSLGILSAIVWLGAFALTRQKILKHSGEVARIALAERLIRVATERGAVDFPWDSIIKIDLSVHNVLLFVSRGVAIMIPAASIPPDAKHFLELKRNELVSPATQGPPR